MSSRRDHLSYPIKKRLDVIDRYSLDEDDSTLKRMKYIPRKKGEKTSILHHGQLKLLLSEIEFLSDLIDFENIEEYIVVYAGAAPGVKNKFLMKLFPNLEFIFIDPAPFDKKLVRFLKGKKSRIISDYMTDDLAFEIRQSTSKKILFISDIRSVDYNSVSASEVEHQVMNVDMRNQEKWIFDLESVAAMLKFRLEYSDPSSDIDLREKYTYLKPSYILIPIFGRRSTTESRFVWISDDGREDIDFDPVEYEEKFFYFNRKIRPHNRYNRSDLKGIVVKSKRRRDFKLCECIDCSNFIRVSKKYLNLVDSIPLPRRLFEREDVEKFIRRCVKECNGE